MSITIEVLESYSIIKMPKLVDNHLATKIREVFDELLEHTNNNVVIDFNETLGIDTSGIGAIAYLFKRLHRRGLTLELIGLQRQPLRKIKALHLNAIITITKKIHHSS